MSNSLQLWTVARQAPWSMEFSRQEYWSGLPFPSPGDLPDLGKSPALQARPFTNWPIKFAHNLSSSWYLVLSYALGPPKEKRWKVITTAEGTCLENRYLSHLWHVHVDRALSRVLLYPSCLFRFPWNICDLLLPICCSLAKYPAWNWNKY